MQACHWKAHNTFTNFYLKDLTWSDDNNMYLGPVVAAQVLDPSPQTSYPRKEKKGRGVPRSLIPGSRYRFTSQDVMGKVFYIISIYSVLCIKDLSRLSLISCLDGKNYENSNPRAGFSIVDWPEGPYTS